MPNWTSNTIRVEGAEADLRSFLNAVKWQDEIFDFNRIIPMPELLKHTGSGHRIIDGKQVDEWYVTRIVSDSLADGEIVRQFTADEESTLNTIGHRSWYSWSFDNWGTKWNACRAEVAEDCAKDGYIEIRLDTAWAPPLPVFEKMFKMFPKLSFVCIWTNEGEPQRYSYSIERDAFADDADAQTKEAIVIDTTTHTPGPWESSGQFIVAPDPNGIYPDIYIAEIVETDDEGRMATPEQQTANASLIVAAPLLLKAASLVIDRWASGNLAEAVRMLGVAVAKAKGGVA